MVVKIASIVPTKRAMIKLKAKTTPVADSTVFLSGHDIFLDSTLISE
jgi:hypothetical protein